MTSAREEVVLLADDGTAVGVADKASVHTGSTSLHLAFSCHLFDGEGRILVTRRALAKSTWPGVWTNSFCGHPAPGEAIENAVHRRASDELGTVIENLTPALPDFRYRAVDAAGIVENEICPVFTAAIAGELVPAPTEVSEWEWVDVRQLLSAVKATPWAFSPWLTLQLPALYADRSLNGPDQL